ncbi:MAG: HIT domain-containing protein [Kiritimatiellae bacterium]|nr:HIT domain-containing protein [Kiritimatiellia bacterium]
MKRIWAPWRMEYILSEEHDGCFLCRAAEGKDDRASLVLKRGETCFVVMNRYPYNNGHLMIAPYRHVGELEAMTREERAEMMELASQATRILGETIHPDGYNVGLNLGAAAGAGVADHAHLHIVPRWNGDTNFMPVLGETKVIPQALLELHDLLQDTWKRI